MQLQQHLDCCHIKKTSCQKRECPTTLGEHGCLHLVVHTSFLFTRCTVSPSKSSKKARCTMDIRMRFLLTILASQDPRTGCLRSHGRAGTTTLTLTVVKVQWQLPRQQTSVLLKRQRRQSHILPTTTIFGSVQGTWRDCLRIPWRRQLEPIPHWTADGPCSKMLAGKPANAATPDSRPADSARAYWTSTKRHCLVCVAVQS